MEFMQIFSGPVLKILLINDTAQAKMCLTAHQNVVWHVWIPTHTFQKVTTKLQVHLLVMVTELLHNLNFVGAKVQVTVKDLPYTSVRDV
jgi:hypothetical protein